MTYTTNQIEVLKAMLAEGQEINGSSTLEEMLGDNMTINFASELAEKLGRSRQSIGGIISGLIKRGLVVKGEKRNKRLYGPEGFGGQWELWLTEAGVRAAFEVQRD